MTKNTHRSMKTAEWLTLILLSMIWGASYFFAEIAMRSFQPFTIVFIRVLIAALALNIVVRASGLRMPSTWSDWSQFLVMGLINNLIPFSLIFWSQQRILSSLASILNATTPVWSVILSHFLTKDEKITANRLVGVIIGLFGASVVIGLTSLSKPNVDIIPLLVVISASISYALAGIYGKRFNTTNPLITAAGQLTASTILMAPIAMIFDRPWSAPPPTTPAILSLIVLGLVNTAFAYILYFRLLASAGATNVLLVTLLNPFNTILLGSVFLGERLFMRHFVGLGIIIVSLLIIDGRFFRKFLLLKK